MSTSNFKTVAAALAYTLPCIHVHSSESFQRQWCVGRNHHGNQHYIIHIATTRVKGDEVLLPLLYGCSSKLPQPKFWARASSVDGRDTNSRDLAMFLLTFLIYNLFLALHLWGLAVHLEQGRANSALRGICGSETVSRAHVVDSFLSLWLRVTMLFWRYVIIKCKQRIFILTWYLSNS